MTADFDYPDPTEILSKSIVEATKKIDKKNSQPTRTLVGYLTFESTVAFEQWQKDTPREIFEITPLIGQRNEIIVVVTYNKGIIGG